MIMEPPDFRSLYEGQRKETEKWREAADVFRKTLRDEFAATCPITLTEFIAAYKGDYDNYDESLKDYAEMRMGYADAMIAAREVKP